jgi:cytochrome c553
MQIVIRTLFAGTMALLSTGALASETTSNPQARLLAAACANCHGTDGKLGGAIPAIAGRPAVALESQLLAFKQGKVANATIMDRISRGYSDDELKQLAQHFSRIGR